MNKFFAEDLRNVDFISSLYDAFASINKKCDERLLHDFFKEISEIIFNYSSVSCRQNTNLNDKQLTKTKECLLIAVRLFNEACEENNLKKLLISLCIFDFLDQNYGLIEISKISEDLKNKIADVLKTTNFEINISKYNSHNDKEKLKILNNLKISTNYSEVIGIIDDIMDVFILQNVFWDIKSTWGILINFASCLDKKIILDILNSTDSCKKIELFLSSLDKEFFYDMSFASELKNNYLVLRVFKYWLLSLEDTYVRFNKLEEIPDYTDYLTSMFFNSDLHLEKYIDILRISHLKSYNYLLGRLVALHKNFLPIYLNKISFGKDETEAFSLGFSEKTADVTACEVIEQIKSKFLAHEIHSYSNINSGTGFLNLFCYYFRIKNPDRNAYLKTLAEYSEKILSEQNSWNHEAVTSVWVDLYYFCLSNTLGKYVFSENELKKAIPALFDERNEVIYDIKSLNVMRTLLMIPNKQIKIKIKPNGLLQYLIEVEEEKMITKEQNQDDRIRT